MKKWLLCLITLAAVLLGGSGVFAREICYKEIEIGMPKTYPTSELQLAGEQDELVDRLAAGWRTMDESIDVMDLELYVEDFTEIGNRYVQILFDETPELYYVDTWLGCSYYPDDGLIVSLCPQYTETDQDAVNAMLSAIDEATCEILWQIDEDMSDFEKVMTVHDYMVLHYEYDESLVEHTTRIMVSKTGVCQSYALAFNHLMNQLDIPSTFVTSNAMEHGWNLVQIDGEWYHIDLTWDDPVADKFAQVRHTYALLSSEAIQNLPDKHYGFDLAGLEADSKLYDKADWRDNTAAIVFCNGMCYWVEDDHIMREDGEKIYNDLDGGDRKWNVTETQYFPSGLYAGLAAYNDRLYFNTDTAICVYDPKTNKVESLQEIVGVCGLFIDQNELNYCKYHGDSQRFLKAGSVTLEECNHRQVILHSDNHTVTGYADAHCEGNEIVVELHKKTNDVVRVISFGNTGCQTKDITDAGDSEVTFQAGETQTLFFWDVNLRPLCPKEVINQ